MWLPFRRGPEHDARHEARRERQVQRALNEESAREVLETEFEKADQDNAGLRFAGQGRQGNGIFGLFGQGARRSTRQQLRDQGYDGD